MQHSSTTTTPKLIYIPHLGPIQGTTLLADSKPQCHYFGPLPYALPPAGQYRWRKPRVLPKGYCYGTKDKPGIFDQPAKQCPQPVGPDGVVPGEPGRANWDEDCLRAKVWVPVGERPEGGWPVLFFIHGGYLQFGSPNMIYPVSLLGETPCQCIIVCPGYRLNLFGFLAASELLEESGDDTVGNYGFWDQRAALEWTWRHIRAFGGDPDNITIGGYSAGAYSTFYQLSHDLFNPHPHNHNRPLARRAIMHSNGPGLPPRRLSSTQSQFNSLLKQLHIPLDLTRLEKLSRLRSLPPATLLQASTHLRLHEFRAVVDSAFVPPRLFSHKLHAGVFARKLQEHGIQIMMGECRDENFAYGQWRSGGVHSLESMEERLCADYEERAVRTLLREVYCPDGGLPDLPGKGRCRGWKEGFGVVYADLQVHAMERGFVDKLVGAGGMVPGKAESSAGNLIHRYRVEHLLSCVDVPPSWGVTHGTDMAIWFWGNGALAGLQPGEKVKMRRFLEPHWRFLRGEDIRGRWGTHGRGGDGEAGGHTVRGDVGGGDTGETSSERGGLMRTLTPVGNVEIRKDRDEDWERGVKVWEYVRSALEDEGPVKASL